MEVLYKLLMICINISMIYSDNFNDHFLKFPIETDNKTVSPLLQHLQNRISFFEWLFGTTPRPEPQGGGENGNNNSTSTTATCRPCECGIPGDPNRIVGGQNAEKDRYTWLVYLDDGSSICGGALITDRHILTAAHCGDFNRNSLIARIHEYNLNEIDAPYVIQRRISKIIIRDDFHVPYNDIAIFEMSQRIELGNQLRTPCLPMVGKSYAGQDSVVAGWGTLSENGTEPATILQETSVPIITNQQCNSHFKDLNWTISDRMLCAGYEEGGKDACSGDSGGPLVVWERQRYVIVGIVSFSFGCARPRRPGVYTRVSKYLDWIAENTIGACSCV